MRSAAWWWGVAILSAASCAYELTVYLVDHQPAKLGWAVFEALLFVVCLTAAARRRA